MRKRETKREAIGWRGRNTNQRMPWGRFKHAKPRSASAGLFLCVLVGATPAILLLRKNHKDNEFDGSSPVER